MTMGMGFRIFLIDDNDSIHRLSIARFERLLRHDPGEDLAQYARKRVRCAIVLLEMIRRKPVAINHIDYPTLLFDVNGFIDAGELEKAAGLVVETLSSPTETQLQEKIIDARGCFAKERYEHEFKWTPTQEIQESILTAIFGNMPT